MLNRRLLLKFFSLCAIGVFGNGRLIAQNASQEIAILTPQGSIRTYMTLPKEQGRLPGVLVIHDQDGPRQVLFDLLAKIASAGMIGFMPDLTTLNVDLANLSRSDQPTNTITACLRSIVEQVPRATSCNGAIGALAFSGSAAAVVPLLDIVGALKSAVFFDWIASSSLQWQDIYAPLQLHIAASDKKSLASLESHEKHAIGIGREFELYVYYEADSYFIMDLVRNNPVAHIALERAIRFFRRTVIH